MKIFLPLIFFILSSAYGATCTNTTRSNYTSNQVLTSSALNADFNQLVTKANALDGGCVTDGTLEYTALDSSLDAVKNGIQQGCVLSYVDANTVSVGRCMASVNGTFIKTIINTNVTWGCTSCSSETSSTLYYVYAKTGSIGTTLNLLISTVAPNNDGYDVTGNKVLGRFYNNSSSAIDQQQIYSWQINSFHNTSVVSGFDSFTFEYGAALLSVCPLTAAPCAYLDQLGSYVTSISGTGGAGVYTILFAKTYTKIKCTANVMTALATPGAVTGSASGAATASITLRTHNIGSPWAEAATYGTVHCEGY